MLMNYINNPFLGMPQPQGPFGPAHPGATPPLAPVGIQPTAMPAAPAAPVAPVAPPAQNGASFGQAMNYGSSAAQQMASQQDAQNIAAAQQLRDQTPGAGGIPGMGGAGAAGGEGGKPGGLDIGSLMKLISMFGGA